MPCVAQAHLWYSRRQASTQPRTPEAFVQPVQPPLSVEPLSNTMQIRSCNKLVAALDPLASDGTKKLTRVIGNDMARRRDAAKAFHQAESSPVLRVQRSRAAQQALWRKIDSFTDRNCATKRKATKASARAAGLQVQRCSSHPWRHWSRNGPAVAGWRPNRWSCSPPKRPHSY